MYQQVNPATSSEAGYASHTAQQGDENEVAYYSFSLGIIMKVLNQYIPLSIERQLLTLQRVQRGFWCENPFPS